jgi:hypothetical protein
MVYVLKDGEYKTTSKESNACVHFVIVSFDAIFVTCSYIKSTTQDI